MEIFSGLIGNGDIKDTLGSAILRGNFSHAYIIEGKEGSGKKTVARIAAAAIMCKSKKPLPCGECELCKKVLNDSCVDVRFYNAFKVEDVRKIKEAIHQSATECDYQIFILNDTQKMTIQAQNALLLSLEEPPKNVVFFLLTTDATMLLETIRSRAQILRTTPIEAEQLKEYALKENPSVDEDTLDKLVQLSGGSLGYLLGLLDKTQADAIIKLRSDALEFIRGALYLDAESARLIHSMFTWQRDRVKELLSLSLLALRDLAVTKKNRGATLCFFTSYDEARAFAARYPLKKLLDLVDAIMRGIDNFTVNASVPAVLTSIISSCN
ncbi:MAG: DNA polymerase III subunit [Clostridia bacterium]|nr:DNA polymerase III subunit [Clostridia bacterium]